MSGISPGAHAGDAIRIVPAESGHGAAIAALHGASIEPPWSEDTVLAALANTATLAFVALSDVSDVLEGFVIAQIAADEAEIHAIAVTPALRRRGIARRLLEAAEARARQCGANRVYLEVADDNAAARQLYAAAGYSQVGQRSGYYQCQDGTSVDAVLLSRAL